MKKYTDKELQAMSAEELDAVRDRTSEAWGKADK